MWKATAGAEDAPKERRTMKLKLVIAADNAAFCDDGEECLLTACAECARILREAADKMERGESSGSLRDLNGNFVGEFKIS
jgi:hypothetical protein